MLSEKAREIREALMKLEDSSDPAVLKERLKEQKSQALMMLNENQTLKSEHQTTVKKLDSLSMQNNDLEKKCKQLEDELAEILGAPTRFGRFAHAQIPPSIAKKHRRMPSSTHRPCTNSR